MKTWMKLVKSRSTSWFDILEAIRLLALKEDLGERNIRCWNE